MWRLAWSHVRGDVRRSLATFVATVLAVTSFVVLLSSATTQRLETTRTVADNFRGAYDILVRPRGAITEAEARTGMVRPNFLSGSYGGISLAQWTQIKSLSGVEVAAPIAVLGSINPLELTQPISLGESPRENALYRYQVSVSAYGGTFTQQGHSGYIYVGKDVSGTVENPSPAQRNDGKSTCPIVLARLQKQTEIVTASRSFCVPLPEEAGTVSARVPGGTLPWLVAAIDPASEAALVGLDKAVTEGRYLSDTDNFMPQEQDQNNKITALARMPALISQAQPPIDYTATVHIERLPSEAIPVYLDHTTVPDMKALPNALKGFRGTPLPDQVIDGAAIWASAGRTSLGTNLYDLYGSKLLRPGDVSVTAGDGGVLNIARQPHTNKVGYEAPATSLDDPVRSLTMVELQVNMMPVGRYDPNRLAVAFTGTGVLPLETYRAQTVYPADAATQKIIGDQLRSDLNVQSYLQPPPTLLVPLHALSSLKTLDANPISAIRVRVAGVTGMDAVSRERIRVVAEDIHAATGLDVDITAGTSLVHQRINLAASSRGTPELRLDELWSKKGVAVEVVNAIDSKSVLLLALILVSGGITVAISATATVASRRRELGVLSTLGWRRGRLFRLVLAELTLLGLGAGLVGAALAALFPVKYVWMSAGLAVPAAVLVTLLAGLTSAVTASRARPIQALRPLLAGTKRRTVFGHHGPTAIGLGMLSTRPGRALLAATAIAIGMASVGILEAITRAFNGRLIGTVLGEVVSLQVRNPDRIAAVCLAALGLISVALVLVLGGIEQASAYATLRAVGWREYRLTWSICVQALVIGIVGALLGAAIMLVAVHFLGGEINAVVLKTALGTGLASIVLTVVVALLPAVALRQLATARALTVE